LLLRVVSLKSRAELLTQNHEAQSMLHQRLIWHTSTLHRAYFIAL